MAEGTGPVKEHAETKTTLRKGPGTKMALLCGKVRHKQQAAETYRQEKGMA